MSYPSSAAFTAPAERFNRALAALNHEFRTPLTAILGALRLLEGPLSSELPTKAGALVRIANTNTARLERLIQDVLLLQALQTGELNPERSPVRVDELVHKVMREFESLPRLPAVELSTAALPATTPIETDGEKLTEVLRRLLDNALRFTDAGEVALQLHTCPETNVPTYVNVIDTGVGIAPEQREVIFRAFEKADNSDTRRSGGLGLGLAIVRTLCDQIGCKVLVESELGVGSRFRVELPGSALPTVAVDPATEMRLPETVR